MKNIKQIVGEKLTREVSQLIAPSDRPKSKQDSGFTMAELVSEAAGDAFQACFENVAEHLKHRERKLKSWKELYAAMIEGWMVYCQSSALDLKSAGADSQYIASRVAAASLLLQIGKEDTSYAQLCDAWVHRSTSPPPGRKQFREAMTKWINTHTKQVMQAIERLQQEYVDQ